MEFYFGVFTVITGILTLFAIGKRNVKNLFTRTLNFITTDCLVIWIIWAVYLITRS